MQAYTSARTAPIKRGRARFLSAALGLFVFAAVASAAPIGDFGFSSTGVLVFQNALAQNFIDWCPTNVGSPVQGAGCGVASIGVGTIAAQPGNGGFSTLASPTPGTIRDTTDSLAAAGAAFAWLPPTPGQLPPANWIHNFLTLSGHSNWDFTATQLEQVACTTIPDQQFCVGPFKLTQTGTGVNARTTVTINIDGILFDSSNSSQANFLAIITGQYVGKDIAAVLSEGQTANGIFSNTISASVITSATPEPATMLISGFGLIALSIAGRRFRRNR